MDLHVRSDEAERLAVELASRTGEPLEVAVTEALRERLTRVPQRSVEERLASIDAIVERVAASFEASGTPVPTQQQLNDRMYDEHGLPH